jgi:hypothetical protein
MHFSLLSFVKHNHNTYYMICVDFNQKFVEFPLAGTVLHNDIVMLHRTQPDPANGSVYVRMCVCVNVCNDGSPPALCGRARPKCIHTCPFLGSAC